MTDYRKTRLTLPDEVAEAFSELDTESRNAYAHALRGLGWTLQSISEASGVTRERVRQVVETVDSTEYDLGDLPLPTPPEKPRREPRQFVEPDADKLAEMLSLQLSAQSVRSHSPEAREAAERYTKLLAESHLEDGVPLYRMSLRLSESPEEHGKVSAGALRARLVRYGYMTTEGKSKAFTPVIEKNRASL